MRCTLSARVGAIGLLGALVIGGGCGPTPAGPTDLTDLGVFSPGTSSTAVGGTQTTTIIDGLTVTPSLLAFGSSANQLTFSVNNQTGAAIGFEVLGGAEWLQVDPRVAVVANGGSVTVTVTIFRVLIVGGDAASAVRIKIPDRDAVSVPITVGNAAPLPEDLPGSDGGGGSSGGSDGDGGNPGAPATLHVSADAINFGHGGAAIGFLVRNSGGGSLSYKAQSNASWLRIENDAGTSSGEYKPMRAVVNRAGLPVGSYTGSVDVTGAGRTHRVNVAMNVASVTPTSPDQPLVHVGQSLLDFDHFVTRLQTFVRNDGAGLVGFRISSNAAWLNLSTSGGVNRGIGHVITLTVNRNGLSPGEYWTTADLSFDNGELRTLFVRMVVAGENPPPTLAVPQTFVDLGTGASTTLAVRARPQGTVIPFRVFSTAAWLSVSPDAGDASTSEGTITIVADRGQLPPGHHYGYLLVVSRDGQLREVQVRAVVPESGNGAIAPMPWGSSDTRLDVISFIEPGAPGYIQPGSVGFHPDWWANTPFVHHVQDSSPNVNSPHHIRRTIEAMQAANPHCTFGTYLSGTECRKLAQMAKFPPESIPYESVSPPHFLTPYDEAGRRASVNMVLPAARKQMADLIIAEALGRGVRAVFLDNMSHPSTGGTLATWAAVCDYLRTIRTALNANGMRLMVNLAVQPYYLAGNDAALAATAVDGFNFEQPFHWLYCRPFPDRVVTEINVYRGWLDAGMHLSIMAAHSEIVYDQSRRFQEARVLAGMCMMVRRPGDSIGVPRSYFETPPDWVNWPAQFGAALGDYQISMPGPVLTREFQNATITVDLAKSTNAAEAADAVTVTWNP